jgi:hypothetical protein
LLIYTTEDSGETWRITHSYELPSGIEPGVELPFSFKDGSWWAATSESKDLLASTNLATQIESVTTTDLPSGVVKLDFVTHDVGWALIQDNQCYGDKDPGKELGTRPFNCHSSTKLYRTSDGGYRWYEIESIHSPFTITVLK